MDTLIYIAFWRNSTSEPDQQVRHSNTQHILTMSAPPNFPQVARRPRLLAPDPLAVANAEFHSCCETVQSDALKDRLVPKMDSGCRPYGDDQALNARTNPARYPIRHKQDYAHHLFRLIWNIYSFRVRSSYAGRGQWTAVIECESWSLTDFSTLS